MSSDALTRAILERLNDEVAKVYAEAAAGGGGGDVEEHRGDGGDYSAGGSPGQGSRSMTGSMVQMPNRPRPVELWRAAHEVERSAKQVRRRPARGVGARARAPLMLGT